MNYVRPSLYARLLEGLKKHPELQKYRNHLVKSCCRPPTDAALRSRLLYFLVQHPELKGMLDEILYCKQAGCH